MRALPWGRLQCSWAWTSESSPTQHPLGTVKLAIQGTYCVASPQFSSFVIPTSFYRRVSLSPSFQDFKHLSPNIDQQEVLLVLPDKEKNKNKNHPTGDG